MPTTLKDQWLSVERDKRDACRMEMDDACEGCDCGYEIFLLMLSASEDSA